MLSTGRVGVLALRFFYVISLTGALAVCATGSWSHAKTDVITVYNGDQITGDGLRLHVDAAGQRPQGFAGSQCFAPSPYRDQ